MKTRTNQISRLIGAVALAIALSAGMIFAAAPVAAQQQEEAAHVTAETPEGEEAEAVAADEAAAEGMEGEETAAEMAAEEAPAEPSAAESNPYGLGALWEQGDFVSKGTLIILVLMSMGSWYVLITKLFEQRRLFDQFNRVIKLFAPTDTLKEGIEALPKRNSYRAIAESGEEAHTQFSKGLSSEVTLSDWSTAALNRGVDALAAKLQGGLALLATVGSTAPFVGLFGTVWGIYHALVAIGVSGQASIDKVAGPVGEALIMTAIGLAVAVPAVLGYNLLTRRNKAVISRARRFATEVHLRILSGKVA
ncbi:MotA/TolQ/ExbB proton channel family protein [Parvibaculum sp.]|jgi:biopolymer transport protein ExbB|uniref:MotA/TolQ/ExbB proton channel family protein n=1 Tax=Parvibaculum sp. TaxID=2024848 RepID=UPI000C4892CC|nr:MotA/TolQ/ExbB proton channel family protein [Parvibaculum sp.]MAM95258.1 biopolymer transporter ExbB [Parvibaculum sp.]HCX69104.1 biopolymer transporter ExbB [Rhodobiaceae bacterium]|tara:strand:+ start:7026 stop:7946 length:921 start_codon:yes stop_codon:yes gene_type:complete